MLPVTQNPSVWAYLASDASQVCQAPEEEGAADNEQGDGDNDEPDDGEVGDAAEQEG